jgi:hypothetical protein
LGAAGHGEHRRPIRPPLIGRHISGIVDGRELDGPGDRLLYHGRGDVSGVLGMNVGAAQLPLGLGPQMPDLPGRPMLLHRGQHPVRRLRPPHRRGSRHRHGGGPQHLIDHRVDPLRSAERVDCFGPPHRALLGEGAGFVLALAGLQCGLLRQLQHLHPTRRPRVITGEVGGELGLPDVDDQPPSRPALVQPRLHADDLPDRPFRPIGPGPFGEPHPKDRGRWCSSAVL